MTLTLVETPESEFANGYYNAHQEMKQLKDRINKDQAELDAWKAVVKRQMENEHLTVVKRHNKAIFRIQRRTNSRIDMESLENAHPRIVASYRKAAKKFTTTTTSIFLTTY